MPGIPILGPRPPHGQLSSETVAQLIFATNAHVHDQFRERHAALIDRAIHGITLTHDYLDVFRSRAPHEQRSAILELLFHAAINGVLCATHHLVSGFPSASGNALRHHTEALAMALLCLDKTSGVFEQFAKSPRTYPVHKAPDRLRQRKPAAALKKLIDFDGKAWAKVLELTELYDALSHASALSLAHTQNLSTENQAILGGEYDSFKADAYEKDLSRCATAAEALAHLMSVVMVRIYPEP